MWWAWLSQAWRGWRSAVHIVKPETVVAWHRLRFRLLWTSKSRQRFGRPGVPADVRALIREMSTANPLWGAPRIHGEASEGGNLGESVGGREVHATAPAAAVTDLANLSEEYANQMMAADLFVVPTVTFRLLFVLLILAHNRRRIVHVAVTDHPTAAWTAQQLRNAFSDREVPHYLLHDRDSTFAAVATTITGMNIEAMRTAPRSPWHNAYVERIIGSIRRECLDHIIVVNAAGLQRVLAGYIAYYLQSRTHLAPSAASSTPVDFCLRPARTYS